MWLHGWRGERKQILKKKVFGEPRISKKGNQPPVQEKAKAARKNQGICLGIVCEFGGGFMMGF
jgi:hypothetical protein